MNDRCQRMPKTPPCPSPTDWDNQPPPPPIAEPAADGVPDTGMLDDRMAAFIRLHHRTLQRYFQSVGMFNGHPHMLFDIRHHPGITQKELAQLMEISPASVAISVRRLESAGLVCRSRDRQDGRVMHLYLTEAGKAMDAACARGRDFLVGTVYQGLSPQERALLYRLLSKMTGNLQAACDSLPPARPEAEQEKEGL